MKKIILLIVLLFPTIVFANSIGPFNENINVSVNCSKCPTEKQEVIVQLYADGELVEGKQLILNKSNNYMGTFTDLPVFKDKEFNQIVYDIKYIENGSYLSFNESDISYSEETITKWVQVLPENVEEGHEYVLFTDNWNYKENGLPKHMIITWDMKLTESEAKADYQIIDDKKSFYSLTMEPDPDNVWKVTKVPSSDPLYDQFKNYLFFTNKENKRITLTGYDQGDWIQYIYKYSGKSDGFYESENAYYTNKVEIKPVANSNGRFMITSHNNINGVIRGTKYLGVDHFNNIVAQAEEDYAAHIMLFEKVENKIVKKAENINVEKVLCENMLDDNPRTGLSDYKYMLIILLIVLLVSYNIIKKHKKFGLIK